MEKMITFKEYCCEECFDHIIEQAEYEGRKVKLNDPFRAPTGDKKKFYVYVKNEKGNVIKLGFGDPNMEIKRDDPARRRSFRARHNCDDPGPKYKARYWSCFQWRAGAKVDEGKHQRKVKQDKEVEDRPGTQPAKYFKGDMKKSTKQARARHFEKGTKMDDDDPRAYKPAPGDKSAKTKPSKHTLKYRKMFGESKIKGLVKKSEKSGISYGILKKVYDRGMAAWRTGHRPGTTPQQWAFARVNSFLTGGGARKADADLWKKR